ncbi:MerR family transcriptional regulator [Paenibacillus sp. Marseille-Q4541]|uniref:MerR family transcriptional regulator n=1 Tax=Paenibacillus sp. Marseille-Q4541 TaxID=2831522 RepID=UPI001BA9A2AB|nr:MerR family transcriptional regulator [Paenibacillus sp. Marseille-Q4541]
MKNYYKINEISKLYGIGVDSLRYYEKIGVLVPRRDTNGYRLYGLNDIYKLNIIRDLRQLDFTMQQIKDYLDHQSIDNTLYLLHKEQDLIREQLRSLQTKQHMIQERINVLTSAMQITTGKFLIKSFPERPCLHLDTRITRDEEMDFAIKKLHKKHESIIHDFGNQLFGASVSVEDLYMGVKDVFNSVFFILNYDDPEYDFVLPAGKYLSLYYRGDYRQSSDKIFDVLSFAKEKGHQLLGDPFEIYEIDNRDTINKDEFLTEIQVRIMIYR